MNAALVCPIRPTRTPTRFDSNPIEYEYEKSETATTIRSKSGGFYDYSTIGYISVDSVSVKAAPLQQVRITFKFLNLSLH